MKRLVSIVLAATLSSPAIARAADWDLTASNRLFSQSIPEDILFSELRVPTTTGAAARTAYQLHVLGKISARTSDLLGLQLGVDTGLLEFGEKGATADGRPIGDRAEKTLFLGETFADVQLGETGVFELRAGKLRANIGQGAIFNAYGFGVLADLDLGLLDPEREDASPWSFRAHALLTDTTFTSERKTSPLLDFEVAYGWRGGSELRFLAAAFIDTEDGLTPVIADAVFRGRMYQTADAVEHGLVPAPLAKSVLLRARELAVRYNQGLVGYAVHTKGVVAWSGVTGKLVADPVQLTAELLVGFGRVETDVQPDQGLKGYVDELAASVPCEDRRPRICAALREEVRRRAAEGLLSEGPETVRLRSLFADARATVTLSRAWAIDGFALAMSGDEGFSRQSNGGEDTYNAFISLAPLLGYTQIFFNGGVAASLASPVAASIAPDGAGLFAVGTGVELTPSEVLRARASGALLFSAVPSLATKSRSEGLELNVELDAQAFDFLVLSANGAVFFPGSYFGDLPAGWQLIAAAHLVAAQL